MKSKERNGLKQKLRRQKKYCLYNNDIDNNPMKYQIMAGGHTIEMPLPNYH